MPTSEEKGKLAFKLDFGGFFEEMMSVANLQNIGPGGMMGLLLIARGLQQMAEIALEKDYKDILIVLEHLGVVTDA